MPNDIEIELRDGDITPDDAYVRMGGDDRSPKPTTALEMIKKAAGGNIDLFKTLLKAKNADKQKYKSIDGDSLQEAIPRLLLLANLCEALKIEPSKQNYSILKDVVSDIRDGQCNQLYWKRLSDVLNSRNLLLKNSRDRHVAKVAEMLGRGQTENSTQAMKVFMETVATKDFLASLSDDLSAGVQEGIPRGIVGIGWIDNLIMKKVINNQVDERATGHSEEEKERIKMIGQSFYENRSDLSKVKLVEGDQTILYNAVAPKILETIKDKIEAKKEDLEEDFDIAKKVLKQIFHGENVEADDAFKMIRILTDGYSTLNSTSIEHRFVSLFVRSLLKTPIQFESGRELQRMQIINNDGTINEDFAHLSDKDRKAFAKQLPGTLYARISSLELNELKTNLMGAGEMLAMIFPNKDGITHQNPFGGTGLTPNNIMSTTPGTRPPGYQ